MPKRPENAVVLDGITHEIQAADKAEILVLADLHIGDRHLQKSRMHYPRIGENEMIEIKTTMGATNVKCIGTGIILLAEAGCIVDRLYDVFKKEYGKKVADAFADTTMQQLANLKEGLTIDGNPIEVKDEVKYPKPEEECEPGKSDLSVLKCNLDAAHDAIEALEKLTAVIEKSKKFKGCQE